MRIAFYCPNKPLDHPEPSGDLVIAQGLHAALNRAGHDCREIVRFRSRWFWKSPKGWAHAALALARADVAARRFRPDVWLTYHTYFKTPDALGPIICRRLHVPYLLFQPAYATKWRKRADTKTGFLFNRYALTSCRHAFTNNLNDLKQLPRIMERRRITYVPPGIYPEEFRRDGAAGMRIRERFGIAPGEMVVMTAAQFRDDIKTVSLAFLLRTLAIVARSQRFHVLIAGGGPTESRLRGLAEELLPSRVTFAGQIPRAEMFRYYSAADVFAFPGFDESLGMVYLEAQSCGLPVAALDVAGVSQVVRHGETGLLAPYPFAPPSSARIASRAADASSPPHSMAPSPLASAIARLLADADLRARLGANARRFVLRERNLHRNYENLSKMLVEIMSHC